MNKTEVAGLFGLSVVGAGVLGAKAGDLIYGEIVSGPAQEELDCVESLSIPNQDLSSLPKDCSSVDLGEHVKSQHSSVRWITDAKGKLSQINSETIDYGNTQEIVAEAKSNLEAVRAEQDNYTVTGGVIGLVALGACVAWRLSRKHRYGVHSEVDSQDVEPPKAPFEGPAFPA